MAQKRIEYYGRFTPTGVDTSQAKRLQALSGLAEQVGDIAFEIGAKIQTKRGQEAGIASGMEAAKDAESPEAPELREGFLSQISIYDQAYNEAALNAYSSGIRVDGRKKLMEFEEQFADEPDPEKFNDLWEGYITGVTKGLPPEMAANLRLSLEDDGMRVGGKIADARRALDFDTNLATVTEHLDMLRDDLAQAVYEADETRAETIRTQIENVLADNVKFIPLDEAQKLRDELEDRLIVQSNLGQVSRFFKTKGTLREQVRAAEQFLSEMVVKDSIDGLTPEQKRQLEGEIAQEITRYSKALTKEDTASAIMVSDFEVGISEGRYTPEETDAFTKEQFELGNINEAKMTSMRKASRAVLAAEVETDQINRQFAAKLKGEGDPMFAPTQSEVNDNYRDSYAPQFSEGTVDQQLLAGAVYIQKINRVPDALKISVNGMITSGQPEQIISAVQFVDMVDQQPGKFESVVDGPTRAFAQEMITLMNAGLEPADAYKRSQQLLEPASEERISVRTNQIKKEYEKEIAEWTTSATGLQEGDRGFADAQREWGALFRSQYLNGSSVDAAKRFADDVMQRNFTESTFGRMMFAPEQYYGDANGSVEYLRAEIAYEIRQENPDLNFDNDNIFLLTDEYTRRTASKANPRYRVMVKDENDELIVRSGYYNASEAYTRRVADEALGGAILTKELREEDIEASYPERVKRFEERREQGLEPPTATDIYGPEGTILSEYLRGVGSAAATAIEAPSRIRRAGVEVIQESLMDLGTAIYESGEGRREALRQSALIDQVEEDKAGQ
jgi:hypothetical protein